MRVGRAALVVAAVGLTTARPVGAGQPALREAWQEKQRPILTRLVERFTGPVPEPCGIAWLPPAEDRQDLFAYPQKAIAAGLMCVLEARERGRATWALWQFQGIDSAVFGGLATTPRGEVHVLHYDNYGGRDDLDATPCLNPRLSQGPGVGIGCDNRMVAIGVRPRP